MAVAGQTKIGTEHGNEPNPAFFGLLSLCFYGELLVEGLLKKKPLAEAQSRREKERAGKAARKDAKAQRERKKCGVRWGMCEVVPV